MGAHMINGEFQSDKYPTTPRGKVPLSIKDPTAQDLLWQYAQRHRSVDAEFSTDLQTALLAAGYHPAVDPPDERYFVRYELLGRTHLAGPDHWNALHGRYLEILNLDGATNVDLVEAAEVMRHG